MIRPLRRTDIPALLEIHRKAGYGFKFPDMFHSELSRVVEVDGKVVGFAGALLEAEIVGMFDPDWGSPARRLEVMAALHLPIAEQLNLRGVKTATVHLDPKFRRFGKRLSQLGWSKALWETYFMSVKDCVKALKG